MARILEEAKTIYESADIDMNTCIAIGRAFKLSCAKGHKAKWLYSLDNNINIHSRNDDAFRISCERGHTEIIKWLYSLDNTLINCLCDYDDYNTNVQLFLSNKKIDIFTYCVPYFYFIINCDV